MPDRCVRGCLKRQGNDANVSDTWKTLGWHHHSFRFLWIWISQLELKTLSPMSKDNAEISGTY